MLNLHKSKLLHNLKPRLFLFSIVGFLAFAGPAVTLPGHSSASNSLVPASGPAAASAEPVQTSCPPTDRSVVGEFGPVTHLPLVPVHLSVLPDGRVLFWGRDMNVVNGSPKQIAGKSEAYVWNISEGSNKTDVAVFRPSESQWYIINSSTGAARIVLFGISGDVPVPGDYDGDGRADLAVFRPSDGTWRILNSSTGATVSIPFGVFTDIVVPGDYDGDGRTDAAVFRPSEGNWYIRQSSNGLTVTKSWGGNGDIPVPKDYDLDRKTDVAVYNLSNGAGFWRILNSSSTNGSAQIIPFGVAGDVPVPGDYSGDGRADPAVFRPSDGTWRIRNIKTGASEVITGGLSTDVVTPGDYDGDGKADPAIFRPSEGNWYIRQSSDGSFQVKTWGINGDIMVPADYDGMRRVANGNTNLFCSGHSFLPDGRLFVAGGHKSPDTDRAGEEDTNIFNYTTNLWSPGPPMSQGRWYPYNVTLSTGEPLIMAGDYWANEPTTPRVFAPNLIPQIYTSGGTLRSLNGPQSLTFYPYLHLTPDGKVFQGQSGFLNPFDSSTISQDSRLLDTEANQGAGVWTNLVSTTFPHAMGTSVLFDSGRKAMIVGGFDNMRNPTREAEFMDLRVATSQPNWTQLASMNSARAYHTATILPDGKVLVSGGVSCPGGNNIDCPDAAAMAPEMWDPMANPTNPALTPWRKMAAHKEVRAYHSVAALLPDGRVLIGGGGLPGAAGEVDANNEMIITGGESHARFFGHKNVEIYSPPYLFDSNGCAAIRPTITSAPASVSYGQTFFVGTSGAGTGAKVSLVRLASVTHGFNQDQRHIFLTATPSGSTGLNVIAPADAHKTPPGYYMLFVLKSNGVPSVSKIVRVLGTPAYEGALDAADCVLISGWAWNRSTPNKPIDVDIYADGVKIATVAANSFRLDLLNGDKGNGFHSFVIPTPPSLLNGQIRSITARFGGTSINLSLTPRLMACNVSLFPTQLPDGWTGGGGVTWEQSTQFSSNMNGKITHIRFYKDSRETGSHVGRIWSDTGVALTPPIQFTNETSSGWQTQALPTPLSITAGVRYRVSYNINFFTAKTFAGLNTPITNPNSPLTAHTSYYSTPAGTFPTTNSGSILFADVVFKSPG